MRILVDILQVIAAFGLMNVWLMRFNQSTAYRGGSATTMHDEFATYGLPAWSMYAVGTLKVAIALMLIIGVWLPDVVRPSAMLLAALMLGAIAMHAKVHDPAIKYAPAGGMLLLALAIVALR